MPDLPAGGGGGASMGGFGCLGMADLAVGEWWVFGCVNCELAKNSETMRFVGGGKDDATITNQPNPAYVIGLVQLGIARRLMQQII